MRFRSRKQQRIYVERRKLVAELLDTYPVCQRCYSARSVDVHELLSRARGGSILDPENLAALCRPCHSFITTNPRIAEETGWARKTGGPNVN